MGFYLVQGGSTLKQMSTGGTLTSVTIPTGITLDATKRLRGVVIGSVAVLFNSPSQNLAIDRFAVARPLAPPVPTAVQILADGAAGSLSGTYRVRCTFIIKDDFGNILSESSMGPVSSAFAITTQYLKVDSTLPVCPITITGIARRVYRTTTGGDTYFPWIDVDGNTVTSVQDDMSDEALQLVAAPTDLGTPPPFELAVAWKDRLWAKSGFAKDILSYSGVNRPFAMASSQQFPIPPRDTDTRGITGLLSRQDELGVGRADSFHKIAGSSTENFTRYTVAEGIGIWAPDSCQVIHDIGYFFGNPFGIYTWGPDGITNISNERVRDWFESDTYFNRGQFDKAVGSYYPELHAYVLNLCGVGSTDLNRWVMYDINSKSWWGPHVTAEFTPTGIYTVKDANNTPMMVMTATNGRVYKSQSTKSDDSPSIATTNAPDFDCETNWFSGGTPGVNKTWLEPTISTKILADAGAVLQLIPRIGKLDASAGTTINHDMTKGIERLRRLGHGEFLQLRIRQDVDGIDVVLYGIEIPFFENGERR